MEGAGVYCCMMGNDEVATVNTVILDKYNYNNNEGLEP
jgi:hypothetical protein